MRSKLCVDILAGMLGARTNFSELVKFAKEKLPNSPGVYYFKNQKDEILYIGKSIRIRNRILQHIQAAKEDVRESRLCYLTSHIDFQLAGTELVALLLESNEIKKHLPLFNRAQRKSRALWGWRLGENSKGYLEIKSERITEQLPLIDEAPFVREFLSFRGAEGAREDLLKTNGFCLSPGSGRACFWHQIDLCQGACASLESAKDYNQRLTNSIQSQIPATLSDQIIVGKGRNSKEKSFVVITQGIYQGYGFVPANLVKNPQALERALVKCSHNSDIQKILRAYFNEKEKTFFEDLTRQLSA